MKYKEENVAYMLVTDDKYELPMCERASVKELAKASGYKPNSISRMNCMGQPIYFNNIKCKLERIFL